MGYASRLTLGISFVIGVFVMAVAEKCSITCSQGEYCSFKCLACPPGTYQKEPIHYSDSCKQWTTKPPLSHYIVAKNGTAVSDVVWRCEDGYREREYTVGGFECVRIQTTPTPVSSTKQLATSGSTYTTEPITVSLRAEQPSGNDNIDGIVGGVIGGVLGLLVIIAIVYLYCKRRLCFAECRLCYTNGITIPSIVRLESGSTTETEPLTPNPNSINYKFCFMFVEELGVHKFKSFLNVLYDPSEQFHAEKVLQFESSKTSDVNTYLTKSFLTWVELNKGIYKSHIVIALTDIARLYVLETIEKLVLVTYLDETNSDDAVTMGGYVRASGAGDETTSSARRRVISQDRFRLSYYLTEQIEADRLRKLLRQLPDSSERFNAYNYYNARLTEERDFSNAFAQTLEEWWLRNLNLSLNKILVDFLKEQGRRDVLENHEFWCRLQRIAKTSNSDICDEDQDSSNNLMSDNIDANQVPYNAENNNEVEHMPNNTEGEDELDNTERKNILDDTERKSMLGDTERKNMLGDTERKNMLGDTERKNMLGDTERKNMLGDTERKNMLGDTERKNMLGDTEKKNMLGDTEREDGSDYTERKNMFDETERKNMLGDTERKNMLGDTERKNMLGDTERKNMLGDTERKNMLGDTERKNMLGDTERMNMLGDTERKNMLGDTERKNMLGDTERKNMLGDTERKNMLGDTERKNMLGDTERMNMLGDTERKNMLGDTERKNMLGDTERKNMLGDTERKNMLGDTERMNMLGDTERKNMLGDTERKNMLGDTERKNMLGDTEREDGSDYTERKNMLGDIERKNTPEKSEKTPVPNNNERKMQSSHKTKSKRELHNAGKKVLLPNTEMKQI